MSLIRCFGKFAGKAAGVVIGGPIQIVGEITGVELIEDIGKGVRRASEFAGDTTGQLVEGAYETVSGLIQEDSKKVDKGLGDMGGAVTRTAKGVVVTAKNTIQSGGEVIGGFVDGDHNRVKRGAASIVKTVAIGALAVGVVDVLDGADEIDSAEAAEFEQEHPNTEINDINDTVRIETINDHLVNSVHPDTGVPFMENTVEVSNGPDITGVFPSFDTAYEVQLNEGLYHQTDYVHFSYANQELYHAIETDPGLVDELGLSPQDVQALANGDTPAGYTWHHSEEPGSLQLVNQEIHAETGHTGGREIWGGGSENR